MHFLKNIVQKSPILLIIVCVVLLWAWLLRFYALDRIPVGGDADSAWTSIDAADWVDRGVVPHYVNAMHAPEPMMVYLIGASIKLFGISISTARLVSATAGLLFVLLLYPSVLTALEGTDLSPEWRRWTALLVFISAAVSIHAMNMSRLGLRATLLPALTCLIFWRLLAAWHYGATWRWALAGFCLGLSLYVYISGRVLALFVILCLLHGALVDWQGFKQKGRGIALLFAVAFLIALPNLILYLTVPASFTARIDASNSAATGTLIWRHYGSDYLGLVTFLGEKLWQSFLTLGIHYPSSYVAMNHPVLEPLFFVGFLLALPFALRYLKQFAFAWSLLGMAVLIIPDLVSSTVIWAHPLRQIGLMPFVYCLSGLGLVYALRLVLKQRTPSFVLLVLTVLAILPSFWAFRYYVTVYAPELYADPRSSWHQNQTDLDISQWMVAQPEKAYLLSYGDYTRQNVAWLTMGAFRERLSILTADNRLQLDTFPDELTVLLTTAPERARHDTRVGLANTQWWVLLWNGQTWLLPPFTAQQETYLLEQVAQSTAIALEDAAQQIIAHAYPIPNDSVLWQAPQFQPLDAQFALPNQTAEVRLVGYSSQQTELAAGQALEISLYWEALRPLSENYEIFVQVWDDAGRVYGASHNLPYEGVYRSRNWRVGELTVTQHVLFLADDFPVGRYRLAMGLYRILQHEALTAQGANANLNQDAAFANAFRILPEVPPIDLPELTDPVNFDRFLRLSALELSQDDSPLAAFGTWAMPAGGQVQVNLAWEVLESIPVDYSLFLHLTPVGELIPSAQVDRALGSDFALPSGAWRTGDKWQDSITFPLDASLAAGDYDLWLGLYYYADGSRLMPQAANLRIEEGRLFIGRVRLE